MNKLFGLALLIIGMVLAVGAGANFRYYSADRHASFDIVTDDNELIDLTPLQPYVKFNGNGNMYVDFSENNSNRPSGGGIGLSPNTTYVFEEMFEVSNELWENNETDFPICVKINTNHEQVKVFAGNYTSPIAGPASNIQFTVYHGNPVKVGMIFDTTNATLGSEQFNMLITADRGTCGP